MGNRLSKIVTRTGDAGETSLADGSRVAKDSTLIHVLGDIDELNSLLGLLTCSVTNDEILEILQTVQNNLFDIGAEISSSRTTMTIENSDWLENKIKSLNKKLTPLKEFILPGGGESASVCHVARAVCRRVERTLVKLGKEQSVNKNILVYINRLSDLLFVLTRTITRINGEKEVYWQSRRMKNNSE